MKHQFERIGIILNDEQFNKISKSKIAIFGLGGVGGYVAEALARSGVSHFLLVDHDTISISNINRQIIADLSSVGKSKCELMKQRILSINEEADIEIRDCFFNEGNQESFDFVGFDYIVDAIDTINSKLLLIEKAKTADVRIISAMGAGNKIDPSQLRVSDIFKTSEDPLAKVMRHELRKRNIDSLKVIYSLEKGQNIKQVEADGIRKNIPGSMVFVPASMGLMIAAEIIKDLINE